MSYADYLETLPKVPRIDLRSGKKVNINPYSRKAQNLPLYDEKKGNITGGVKNFLDMIGALPFDVHAALNYVIKSYRDALYTGGLELISTPRQLQNGTLVFKQHGTVRKINTLYASRGEAYEVYKIGANGQIRQATVREFDSGTTFESDHYRLKSPQPATDKFGPGSALIATYIAAMVEMKAKYLKKMAQMAAK